MAAKILVVDDEPDLEVLIRQRFRAKVRDGEYELFFAGNGIQALERLDEHPDIDVVLTDLNMPEMDGLTLLGALATREELLKSVVVSAYDDMNNIRTAMNRGAFDFITKPIDFADLEVTLEKTLREVRNLREGRKARQHLLVMANELDTAGRIQQTSLPKAPPPELARHGVEVAALMTPAQQVGGDFYDYFLIGEEHLGLVIGDVAGKGIPAALLMAVARSLLKATALTGVAPGEVLEHVNKLLCSESPAEVFVTLFFGSFNLRDGELRYSNGGHNPPYLFSVEGAAALDNQGGLVLGVEPESAYETSTIQIESGGLLLLYTDGVTEAMNPNHALFGEERMITIVGEADEPAPDATLKALLDAVHEFADGAPQHDDITMLALRRKSV